MSIDTLVEWHYTPNEYRIAQEIFKKLQPEWFTDLNCYIHLATMSKKPDDRKYGMIQLHNYVISHCSDLGETLYHMYANIYMCIKRMNEKEYDIKIVNGDIIS